MVNSFKNCGVTFTCILKKNLFEPILWISSRSASLLSFPAEKDTKISFVLSFFQEVFFNQL